MITPYLVNDTYYYVEWGPQNEQDFFYDIEHENKIKHVILFGPEEHEMGSLFTNRKDFKRISRFLQEKNITYEVIVSACSNSGLNKTWQYHNQKNFLFWETFFAFKTVQYSKERKIEPFAHNQNISKHFISLNGRAHPWRCMFIDHLAKHKLMNHGYVSWHNSENWDYQYRFKHWKPKIINFDENWINNTDGILEIMIPPKDQFKDSLFSVISESNDQILKVTEKTYIPIYHKRPFIIYGPQFIHKYLQKQGFLLFDEIFNYDFDFIPNDSNNSGLARCEAMMNETKKIINYDPNDLYKMLKPKIDYNYKNLLKVVKQKYVDKRIVEIINNMTKQIDTSNYLSMLKL